MHTVLGTRKVAEKICEHAARNMYMQAVTDKLSTNGLHCNAAASHWRLQMATNMLQQKQKMHSQANETSLVLFEHAAFTIAWVGLLLIAALPMKSTALSPECTNNHG
jgi:hypothetical protein